MQINFFNAEVKYKLSQKKEIQLWLKNVAKREDFQIHSLNIIFCSDKYLHALNVRYLAHDTLTDIITFDQSEEKGFIQGELYISIERIRENAQQLKMLLRNELHRVMVHGLLHLCGYTDKTKKDKLLMSGKEDFYLSLRKFL